MKRFAFLLAPALIGAAPTPAEPGFTLVYAGEALLQPGKPAERGVLIKIRSDRIESIAVGQAKPGIGTDGFERLIDLSCCFILPGLIDVQTHLSSQGDLPSSRSRLLNWSDARTTLHAMEHARNTLRAGFTTIRDMGHHGRSVFAVRDAIEAGLIEGPRMQVAGEVIRPTGGELRAPFREDVERAFAASAICDGADDCQRAVRAEAARGADTIKVETKRDLVPGSPSQFDQAELNAIRKAAHALGLKVTASSFSAASINEPLEAGFDAVVHGAFADRETLRLLQQSHAYFIPTLAAAATVKEMAENPVAPVSAAWRAENLRIHDGMVQSFRLAMAAGVKIAFGTDAGWRPHGRNAEQMVQMVALGMPAAKVLEAATVNAAAAMGWEGRVGVLQAGAYADIVATALSPLADMQEVTRPLFVMKDGKVVRDDLRGAAPAQASTVAASSAR